MAKSKRRKSEQHVPEAAAPRKRLSIHRTAMAKGEPVPSNPKKGGKRHHATDASAQKTKAPLPASTPQNARCILFVDDEEPLTELGQEMLDCLGYEVVVRTRSADALEAFRETPQRFDLVLTDHDMPHMTGEALARALWGIRPDIPIILCTGGSKITGEKAQRMGFDTLLRKPFGLHDIASAIQNALEQHTKQQT